MRTLTVFGIGLLACSPALFAAGGLAQTAPAPPAEAAAPAPEQATPADPAAPAQDAAAPEEGADEGPVEFTAAFMDDPAVFTMGKEVWDTTCQSCHGAKAYPGKAPKLKPAKYTPEFVFDRVTNGFRKMPAWKDVFDKEQRMAVSAYVKSRKFAP